MDATSEGDASSVDAVVLVGGKGTRQRPLTLSAPKPMLPTAGLPFLTHLLSRIAAAGIEYVILGTAHQAAVFESEFGDGSKLGLEIEYAHEETPLGTGGGIANIAPKLRHDTAVVRPAARLSSRARRRRNDASCAGGRSPGLRLRADRC